MDNVSWKQNSILKKSLLKSNLKLFLSLSTCQTWVNNCSPTGPSPANARQIVQHWRTFTNANQPFMFLRSRKSSCLVFDTWKYVHMFFLVRERYFLCLTLIQMEKEDVSCENIKGVTEGSPCRWRCLHLNPRDGENIFFVHIYTCISYLHRSC